jgi:hypothetical protein
MTAIDDETEDEAQTMPRRLAVLVSLGFALLIAAGPLLLVFGPEVHNRAARPMPEWSTEAFLAGEFTEDLRLHLRETSPVTVGFRRVASEAQYLLGIHESLVVVVGRGGALFASSTLRPQTWALQRDRDERQAFLRELGAWTQARGIELLVLPVPDKARVLEERLPGGGPLDARKRAGYAALLDELRDAGLDALDLAAAMAAWRGERPEVPLYHDRDTHWTSFGAWRVSCLAADALEARGWLAGIEPAALVAMPAQTIEGPEDLAGLLGFFADGMFAERLRGSRTFGGARLAVPGGGSAPMPRRQAGAGIALCGDSFADGALIWTLPLALGRLVDSEGAVPGKGPLHGLLATLERIAAGELRPKVICWEFVERSQAEGWWAPRPRLP